MLRARGNHVNCMLMSSSGGRNIEAFQRNTLKPLGEIMRARSSRIKPNRLSVPLFSALALPVAGNAVPQDPAQQEGGQAPEAPAQASEGNPELERRQVNGSRLKRAEKEGPAPGNTITDQEP